MFRFSCFHSPTHAQKPKKTVQLPTEAMQKTLEDYNIKPPTKDPVSLKEAPEGKNANNPSPSSMVQAWKSEGLKCTNDNYSEDGHQIKTMRKSVSLGSGLAHYQDMPPGDDSSSSHNNRSDDKDEYHNAQASISPQISSNLVNPSRKIPRLGFPARLLAVLPTGHRSLHTRW
ncbi:hypothetical protein L2E82_21503 [Cichorium intybus]|uniref:Uncharacterized protein n=1 Tax=Cichorium intybus TaxID=13427 RepID=A0ACB9DW84_CICIN|nr:hypothetical protein L2E82_21503 [Cichorium intybus]